MPPTRGLIIFFSTAALVAAQDSSKKELTARELFYAAAQASVAPTRPSAKAVPHTNHTPPKAVEIARAGSAPRVPAQSAATPTPATAPLPANGEPPLGLRYTLERIAPGTTPTSVPADSVFHAGDRIKLSVQASGDSYLYIINQGSSGTWKPMFPSPEIDDGDNHVQAMRPYSVPPGKHVFTFDSTAGTENLFVVLTRKPEPDLEAMIYSLQGKKQPDKGAGAPAHTSKEMVMAVNISNTAVDRMRDAYSRDLIIEKVDTATPGDQKETAVYIVNASGSADSRVVADLHLVHQ